MRVLESFSLGNQKSFLEQNITQWNHYRVGFSEAWKEVNFCNRSLYFFVTAAPFCTNTIALNL